MIIIHTVLTALVLNLYLIFQRFDVDAKALFILLGCVYFVTLCIFPVFSKKYGRKMRILHGGQVLLTVFLITLTAEVIMLISLILAADISAKTLIINSVIAVIGEFIIFWDGIIRVYCTSTQLGIKWRTIGAICGMIPILNIVMLIKIISVTAREYRFESMTAERDRKRADQKICKTKYPILLVHGVFFRDTKLFNYWGRIADSLEKNGAEIYYGNQQSASSVEDSAKELAERIKEITEKSGCEKVNIIAHSKGGLDSRYALSVLGADKYVASLTTVNTPHRGCLFAEYLLNKVSENVRNAIADKYNSALKKIGDPNPDFIAAVTDLTASACAVLNEKCPDCENVYYQSIGSKAEKASNGQFPLNLSYRFVKLFDGENDGLVSADAMKWGSKFTFLEPKGKRGITHGDVIDLNRENIKGFDVREFYVGLVSDLREKGF